MNILIIGGGISGVSAAKVALKQNHNVTIIEQAGQPGGLMAKIANCRIGFKTFFDEIIDDPNLKVIRDGVISQAEKEDNVFKITLQDRQSLIADRIIIATGLKPYEPDITRRKRILTSLEYDALIDQRNEKMPEDLRRVAFVLCIGSRSKENPLCSSVCCSYTLREIKWTFQRINPEITVFYNDLRFFGQEFFMESAFREKGVEFIRANTRYLDEDEDGVTIRYFSGNRINERRFEYVVLAIGLMPNPELLRLSSIFGFSLTENRFVNEYEPLKTDVEGIYVSGGALEPMSIKDAILTGFGAAYRCITDGQKGKDHTTASKIYMETPDKEIDIDGDCPSYLFYIGTEDPLLKMLYEYFSYRIIEIARGIKKAGKDVCVVTKNMVMPSTGELDYEKARREGVLFYHMEEDESIEFREYGASIIGSRGEVVFEAGRIVRFEDLADSLKEKEFLIKFRSEPQLRWSPTKWGRKRYHIGFIRYPRAARWQTREYFGALGEILIDTDGERVLPEVNEERCSGCGSCRDACPHDAIEIGFKERQIALFGPLSATNIPIARLKEDACVGCGLCASTCPSDSIVIQLPK